MKLIEFVVMSPLIAFVRLWWIDRRLRRIRRKHAMLHSQRTKLLDKYPKFGKVKS